MNPIYLGINLDNRESKCKQMKQKLIAREYNELTLTYCSNFTQSTVWTYSLDRYYNYILPDVEKD